MPDSPALNAGSNALAVDPDGVPLEIDIYGNPRIQEAVVDIGAVEGATEPSPAVTYVVESLEDSIAQDGILTFREAFEAANWNASVGDAAAGSFGRQDRIEFAAGISGTILLEGQALTIRSDLVIEGPGADRLGFDAQGGSGIFHIRSGKQVDLTGMEITGGNADIGGGICSFGTLVVGGLIITGNTAGNGGGVFGSGALSVTNSTISDNCAAEHAGGIYNCGTLTLSNSTIAGNSAGWSGGGIFGSGSTLSLANSTIARNSAGWSGGAIYSERGTLTVTNSTIAGNSAEYSGGGIYSQRGTLTVTNSTISGNLAGRGGGGISCGGTVTISNATIAGNSAGDQGGGIRNGGTLKLTNSVVAYNIASGDPWDLGGAVEDGSDYNLIGIWSEDFPLPGEHNLSGTFEAPLDPGLSHWTHLGGGVWGYRLLPESPALNAGSNALAVDPDGVPLETDLYGNPRIQDGVVDIGSVEGATEPGPSVAYIVESLENSIAEDGILTFREAFDAANLNRAVGDAPAGSFAAQDRIEFTPGLSGTFVLGGRLLTIYGDLVIEGPGMDGLAFDAQQASGVFQVRPAVQVAVSGATITGGHADRGGGICNFGTLTITDSTITENSATGYDGDGGGICSYYGTLTVICSTIAGNSAGSIGGGIYSEQGTLTVTNSTIAENSAADDGGGIYTYEGTVTVTHSTIAGNSANYGGAIYSYRGTATLTNSTIAGNSVQYHGGGITSLQAMLTVTNSTVAENLADDKGGGIYISEGTVTITHSTVAENSANYGGAIYSYSGSGTATLTHSTIAGNSVQYNGGGIYLDRSTMTVRNTIVAQNSAGTNPDVHGSLATGSEYDLIGIWTGSGDAPANTLYGTREEPLDPRLGPLGDYGGATWTMPLLGDSPAVDAGDPEFDPFQFDPPLLTDQRGAERIVDGDGDGTSRVDMGAFEYVPGEALVFGRHVFYNASNFDGEDPAANQADDAAIAPDKEPLLPGQAPTFANYTSYSRGINGIMIDVANLARTPTGEDFEFRVGNDDEPAGWPAAATPEISVRQGAGIAGSDRITLVWPDNIIQKQWLQVSVLPGGNTGLLEPDVFYFGNAIGESGNSATDAKVNATDMLAARNNQRTFINPAPIDFDYDYDRDARVNATDMLIARNNQTNFLDALDLITVPNKEAAAAGCWSPGFSLSTQPKGWTPTAAGTQSTTRQSVSARLAWLYQFDEIGPRKQPSEKGEPDDGPLAKVLATYGL